MGILLGFFSVYFLEPKLIAFFNPLLEQDCQEYERYYEMPKGNLTREKDTIRQSLQSFFF